MTSLHSKQHTFLIGQESTFGTAVTADKDVGTVQSVTPADSLTINEVGSTGSREIQQLVAEKYGFKFDVENFMQHGRWLEYAFGSVTHAETTGDWKHTFDVAESIPSFTAESSFNAPTDQVFIYSGCKVNTLGISMETNGKLTYKPSIIAQSVDTSTSTASASVISDLQILHFKNSSLSVGTAGSESNIGKLQTFNFNLENNLIEVDAAGNIVVQELSEGDFRMKCDFTMTFENMTEFNRFLGGTSPQEDPTKFSLVFNANNGVALGSGRREFYIQMNDCLYTEPAVPVQVGNLVIATFKATVTNLGTNKCYYVDNIADTAFS